ncbi:hypothetical protein D3C80_1753190 [compost metagenome]
MNIFTVAGPGRFADRIALANRFEKRVGIRLAKGQEAEMVGLVDLLVSRDWRLCCKLVGKHGGRYFTFAAKIDEGQRNIDLSQAVRLERQRQTRIDQHGGTDAWIAVLLLETGLVDGS